MTVDIDKLTHVERQDLLRTLLDGVGLFGPLPLDDVSGVSFQATGSDALVPPNEVATVICTPQMMFKPQRFVILEPLVDFVEREFIEQHRTEIQGALWWKRYVDVVASRRTVEHTRTRRIERASWSIVGAFIGNRSQWPSHGTIPGDAFGPSGKFDFSGDTCPPDISITLQVRNNSSVPAPFRALIIGKCSDKLRSAA